MWGHWHRLAAPRGGLRLIPSPGLLLDSTFPSLFDPAVSCLSPVVGVHGPTGNRAIGTYGPHRTLEALFDGLAFSLGSLDLLHTLSPAQAHEVSLRPRLLFSYQPAGAFTRGSVLQTPVCCPYFPSRCLNGFMPTAKGYLRVYLGTMGPEGGRFPVYEYAHRLVAAAALGADWHALLGRPRGGTRPRFEVSHICGNPWCLCPSHLKVVDKPRDNVIELPHLRPRTLGPYEDEGRIHVAFPSELERAFGLEQPACLWS
jgi:hypothetical protein